jgi:hypothetical protein
MAAAAHDPDFAQRNKIPGWVAKEFNQADAGTGIIRPAKKSVGGAAATGVTSMASRSAKRKASSSVLVAPSPKGEPATQIPGKDVMIESKQRSKGFKKGGGVKSESVAEGTCQPGQRMDKPMRKARGGSVNMRGRSPLSAAASTSAASTRVTH